MHEYRMTRNWPYIGSDIKNLSARQGYYINAINETEARKIFLDKLKKSELWQPEDELYGITCQLWKHASGRRLEVTSGTYQG